MKEHFSVLIIDDDQIHNFIVSRLIRKINSFAKINTLINGREGLQYINNSITNDQALPSLIIVDINMPVMSGIEFLEELKKINFNFSNHPIIFISNEIHPKDYEKLKLLGACKIVLKPLTEEKLSEALSVNFKRNA